MKIKDFKDIKIWQESVEILIAIYRLTYKEKFSKDFGLRDQIRREILSVSSNIAEGFEIGNNNDLIRFLKISKGSVGEVRSQLLISAKLKYISDQEFNELDVQLIALSAQIGGFLKYLLDMKNNNEFKTR